MNRSLLSLLFPVLLATGPAPLIVGSVRDQYGDAVFGARISAGAQSTRTDARGTFALESADAGHLRISCDYCDPLTVAVTPGEPVIALVHRYDALADDAPTQRDIAFVPYARAESIAALRPFMVLENSSQLLPGAQLSDRGSAPRGMLVQVGGIPVYDIATNESPFVAFPSYDIQQMTQRPPSDAFRYGDLAGGGTLLLDTQAPNAWDGAALGGSSSALRAAQTFSPGSWSTGTSHEGSDSRARADGALSFSIGDDAYDFRVFGAQDRNGLGAQHLDSSDGGLRVSFSSVRANRIDASLTADGGQYGGATPAFAYSARWSDLQAQGGITTQTPVQFFANAGIRNSSGYYSTAAEEIPFTAGVVTQTHVDAGAQTSGDRYQVRLGVGAFDTQYIGGASAHRGLSGEMIVPGFTGSYAFDPHWTYELQAGESFYLPTILEAFTAALDGGALVFDRNMLVTQTLDYGDLHRFHAAITDMNVHVTGLDNGFVHSFGVSLGWQIAPMFSVRAWLLRDNDETRPYESIYRFGARPQPATVGSYWLTYENPGLRIDAIYRRDLLDYRIDPHFDASISAPISARLRLFGATERLAGSRAVTIGIRAEP